MSELCSSDELSVFYSGDKLILKHITDLRCDKLESGLICYEGIPKTVSIRTGNEKFTDVDFNPVKLTSQTIKYLKDIDSEQTTNPFGNEVINEEHQQYLSDANLAIMGMLWLFNKIKSAKPDKGNVDAVALLGISLLNTDENPCVYTHPIIESVERSIKIDVNVGEYL